jgi:hypothetical protein
MGIKRWKHDKVFSEYIRKRDGWVCQRCKKGYDPESSTSRMGLHCSHYYGRGNWSTRFEPDNCVSLCYGCHRYLGSHPAEHSDFINNRLKPKRFKRLKELYNKKVKRRDYLNDHFYNELKLMVEDEDS